MFKDITLGQYFPGNSIIHNLDPRVKIMLTILYIILLFMVKNFSGFAVFALFTLLVICAAKIPFKYVFKGLRPLLFIIIFTAILNVFMTQGRIAFQIPYTPITATWEGIYMAAFMIIRLMFLLVGTSVLTLTSSPISLTDGIEHLLSPFKKIGVPAHELAMMMTIAIRFIPTLLEETEKIMKAQTSRGADFETGNLIKRAKSLVPLLVPLFISAFRRADELALAMECRCYNGGVGRTRMKQLKITGTDIWCSVFMIAVLSGAAAIGYMPFLF
mgnify:CR=1 FL=1